MDELGDIVQEFLVESHENLDQLDRDLVALEQQPGSRELLSSIFRTIHTIKGTSGFLAFNRLERVTHVGESLLSRLRDGTQSMTPETTNALLRMVDTVRTLLTSIEQNGTEGDADIDEVIAAVTHCIEGGGRAAGGDAPAQPAAAPATAAPAAAPATAVPAAAPATAASAAAPATAASAATPATAVPDAASAAASAAAQPAAVQPAAAQPTAAPQPAQTPQPAVQPAVQKSVTGAATPAGAPSPTAPSSTAPVAPATVAGVGAPGAPAAGPDTTVAVPRRQPASVAQAKARAEELRADFPDDEVMVGPGRRSIADSSIRVDVDLLDTLMRLVGELVLTRNQMIRTITTMADPGLTRSAQRLNLITSELQESVMKTRMQAIDHLWSKLPRVVRDLSSSFGKRVRLEMQGKETELDRSLLESVKDPLTHLVRNAVDHGIERPEDRAAKGKNPEGTLMLRAYHEGGHVIVEVRDDGNGIDPEKIAKVALERGVIGRDQLVHMDRREILNLVFRPGFSTAEKITNVSGRGVGMDVVKTNIERIGGAVDVDSVVGQGTTWRLTIPLTLAIIQALTIECSGQRYVIPQVAVHELVYLDGQGGRVIEHAMGAPVYRLRGKLLPLVRLDQALDVAQEGTDKDVYVAVLQSEGRRFGLVVDKVLNTEEVVVKPLTARFKDIGVYAGATLLGDGRVALILDVASLARRANLNAAANERAQQMTESTTNAASTVDRLLIAGIGDRRVAIPLDMVTRLEEFSLDRLERVGNREVVQYRDQILPVARLAHVLGAYSNEESESLPVVVYTEHGRSVGLAVDRIVDIVEEAVESVTDFGDDGLTGSAVIQQRVTELLDVRRAILAADPRFDAGDAGGVGGSGAGDGKDFDGKVSDPMMVGA